MGNLYLMTYSVLSGLTFLVMGVVDTVFRLIYGRGRAVPRVQDPLLLMPALEIANKIRARKIRAEDVMSSYIVRAKSVNPIINAIVGDQYDQALRRAQALDSKLDALSPAEIGEKFSATEKPLLGVPLSVKEAFSWTGMTNTSGIAGRKHLRSTYDAPVLRNLQAAGAIPFILTNVSEACMWFESSNYVYGCTNNAYDSTRIVGGSSGGEGCVISAAASVIGIGSDIGGSIRMPCFFNGIFGHKPSVGVVDNSGQFPIATPKGMPLLATGPMCRYASDLDTVLRVMAGPAGVAKLSLDTKVDLSRLRVISVPDDAGGLTVSKVDKQLKEAQRKVCEYLASLGATVEERSFPKFRLALDMWTARMNLADDGEKFSVIIAGEDPNTPQVKCFRELARWLVGRSTHTLPALLLGVVDDFLPKLSLKKDLKSVKMLDRLREELLKELDGGADKVGHNHSPPGAESTWQDKCGAGEDMVKEKGNNGKGEGSLENGLRSRQGAVNAAGAASRGLKDFQGTVLLYPSHPKIAPYHNHPIFTPFNFAYTGLFNALEFPVTQCPLGLSREGLPLGLQVVAAPQCDHLSLAVARALEEGFGGWVNPGTI